MAKRNPKPTRDSAIKRFLSTAQAAKQGPMDSKVKYQRRPKHRKQED